MERRRFSQTMASEWQTAFVVSQKCHGMLFSLPSKITTNVFKNCISFSSRPRPRPRPNVQDQDFMIQDQDQDFHFFVLDAPRDQDPGLEDYITAWLTLDRDLKVAIFSDTEYLRKVTT